MSWHQPNLADLTEAAAVREGGYMKGIRPWHGSACLHSWGCCENSKGAQETFLVVRPTSQGTPTGSSAKPNPSPDLLWSHRVHSLCTFILSLSLSSECAHVCLPYHSRGGRRATCRSWFSSSTAWVPGIELGHQAWWQWLPQTSLTVSGACLSGRLVGQQTPGILLSLPP